MLDFPIKTFEKVCTSAGISILRDLKINDRMGLYWALLRGETGFGEAYVAGFWESEHLEQIIAILLSPRVQESIPSWFKLLGAIREESTKIAHMLRLPSFTNIFSPAKVGKKHYDLGGDLYGPMLDHTWKYTSGYPLPGKRKFDLEKSQKLCMEMLCQRLDLAGEMDVLEVGFGYGTLASYMAKNYKSSVTGLTVSRGQMSIAEQIGAQNMVSDKLHFILQNWKRLYGTRKFTKHYKGKFDRIVSVEMIEAVATSDLPKFFKFLYECLKPNGKLVIQAINSDRNVYSTDGFIHKYIFPNGVIPSVGNITHAATSAGFSLAEIDNSLGEAYYHTLMAWWDNFQNNWFPIKEKYKNIFARKFPYHTNQDVFFRIWEYYLKSCAGSFMAGHNWDGHFVFTKGSITHSKTIIPTTMADVERILAGKIFPSTEGIG